MPRCPLCDSTAETVTIGMSCQSCGTLELKVLETSHAAEGIVRLRECRVCHSRIRTIETILTRPFEGRGSVRGRYPPLPKG
jgi:hypothetical protein